MKIKNILTLAALATPFAMSAVPAFPGLLTVENSDGSKIEVRLHGDEHFSYFTDAENKNVLELDGNGTWTIASRNGRLLRNIDTDINLLRAEVIPYNQQPMAVNARMARLDNSGRTTYPTIGDNIRALVILIEFQDVKFTVPDIRNTIDRLLNEEGFNEYSACGSARDYYKNASNGKFAPIFDVCEPVTVSHDLSYYGKKGGPTDFYNWERNDFNWDYALAEAVRACDANGVDFSKYDYDDDGLIDNIFFFYAGHGEADYKSSQYDLIWPHQGDYRDNRRVHKDWEPVVVDGKTFATYACGNELPGFLPPGEEYPYLVGIGTFCHEYGHVLGLPDLYDTNGAGTKTPGKYSIMDQGSYNGGNQNAMSTQPPSFSAYERWLCRWAEMDIMEEGHTFELPSNSLENEPTVIGMRTKRVVGNLYNPEYYFFETRTKDGWDSSLPQHGMFIWHMNYSSSAWMNNEVNTNKNPRLEMIGYNENEKIWTWGLDNQNGYVYPECTNAIKPTLPSASEFFLTEIKFDEEAKKSSFSYNVVKERPDITTVINDTPTHSSNAAREVYLTWEPVEGATSYELTVYRVDNNGNRKYIDNLNETNVGNVRGKTVRNISKAVWDIELHAYVRVVKGIPSTEISNTISFIPSSLAPSDEPAYEVTTGVGSIFDSENKNFDVFVEGSTIYAPEGAEIYTLNGMKTGSKDLPKGIYVVRFEGKSLKVYVK